MLLVVCIALLAVQFVASLPWVVLLNMSQLRSGEHRDAGALIARRAGAGLGILGLASIFMALTLAFVIKDPDQRQFWGGIFGFILHVQLTIDFFVLAFVILLAVWPKG